VPDPQVDSPRSLAGRKALVTGASAGIGAAIARRLAMAGVDVALVARRADRLQAVLADCKPHAPGSAAIVADLSEIDAVTTLAKRAAELLGGIDILINNAGIPKRRFIGDLSLAEVDAVIDLNYRAAVRLILAVLPRMREQAWGRVVNISSVAARLGPPHEAAYAASKAALTAFSECMAVDLAGSGVEVFVVSPGIIDTELFSLPDNEPSLADLPPLPPEEVAEAVQRQLVEGKPFEVFVPAWFADIASTKAANLDGFLEGSAAWLASREQELGLRPTPVTPAPAATEG